MKVVLFDPSHRDCFYPFTLTRPMAELRKGIGTFRETWQKIAGVKPHVLTVPYLSDPADLSDKDEGGQTGRPSFGEALFINAALVPDGDLWSSLSQLAHGAAYISDHTLLAFRTGDWQPWRFTGGLLGGPGDADDDITRLAGLGVVLTSERLSRPIQLLRYPWQLVQWNGALLRADFALCTADRQSAVLPASNQVISPEDVFVEEGARVSYSVLNASTGPIYIGRNAEVMEGCLIRGPFSLAEGACLKMGTKVYGATTLGPYCIAGGDIKNVIMLGYSNKAHDGYLGDALIGEWCNLGAGTTNSNIRNNATEVRVWNPGKKVAEIAGPKAGLLMGDFSRSSIQSAFNTGAVVGVCCNVFGGGVYTGYLPDFSWGQDGRYEWDKVIRDIDNWKKLKGHHLTAHEIQILQHIFDA